MKLVALFMILALAATARSATIADTVATTPQFTTLAQAATAAGLVGELADPTVQLTVFAPTDEAFIKLLTSLNVSPEELLMDTTLLRTILLNHVVPGVILSSDLVDGQKLQTLSGSQLTVSKTNVGTFIVPTPGVGPAAILTPDVLVDNGVIHIIDTVLVPGVSAPAAELMAVPVPELMI